MADLWSEGLHKGFSLMLEAGDQTIRQQEQKSREAERRVREKNLAAELAQIQLRNQQIQTEIQQKALQDAQWMGALSQIDALHKAASIDPLQPVPSKAEMLKAKIMEMPGNVHAQKAAQTLGNLEADAALAEQRRTMAEFNRLRPELEADKLEASEERTRITAESREKVAREKLAKAGVSSSSNLGKVLLEKDAITAQLQEALDAGDEDLAEELQGRLKLYRDYSEHLSGTKKLPPMEVFAERHLNFFLNRAAQELTPKPGQPEPDTQGLPIDKAIRRRAEEYIKGEYSRLEALKSEKPKTEAPSSPKTPPSETLPTPESVREAFRKGEISREMAERILREKFNFTE